MSVRHTGRYICSRAGGGGRRGGEGGLLGDLVPMLEKKKQNKRNKKKKKNKKIKTTRKDTFFKLGSAQRCHRLGSEKWHFSWKRVGFLKSDKNKKNKKKKKKRCD